MEYVEGGTLLDHVKGIGKVDEEEARLGINPSPRYSAANCKNMQLCLCKVPLPMFWSPHVLAPPGARSFCRV